eukprot:RCo044764
MGSPPTSTPARRLLFSLPLRCRRACLPRRTWAARNTNALLGARNPLEDQPSPRDLVPSHSEIRGFRLPLRIVFVAVLSIFAVGPAIALWMISWRAGQNA